MSKNKKTVMTENDHATSLDQEVLDKSTVTSLQFLIPSITVLGDILIETNDNFQALVSKSQTLPSAKEAGKTLRYLSKQYAKVLIAALEYPYDDIQADEDDELEFEDEDKDEEEQI